MAEDDDLPAYSRAPLSSQMPGRGHSATLHRSASVMLLTVLYVGIALYAWVVIVFLSFRPVTTKSWSVWTAADGYSYPDYGGTVDYTENARIYHSARVLQTFINVVTIPWISTVCASAAVIFVQNQRDVMGLSLRQVMTLADRRWLDLSLYHDLPRAWRKHGSSLLWLAIALHILGAITYPIQSIFLSSKTITVPMSSNQIAMVADLASVSPELELQVGADMVNTRIALANANPHSFQPQLWQGNKTNGGIAATLNDFLSLSEPFYAQVPTGTNTGLLRQFSLRINSTASCKTLSTDQFPSSCDAIPGAFYASYSTINTSNPYDSWGIVACMPANLTHSPWSLNDHRQDFSEQLYLNLSYPYSGQDVSAYAETNLFQITVNTTAGYFELPNYMNNGLPGPLLEDYTSELCGADCVRQSPSYYYRKHRVRDENENDLKSASWTPITMLDKGPLLTTATALFGPGSFLETFPSAYSIMQTNLQTQSLSEYICMNNFPLSNFFSKDSGCNMVWAGSGPTYYDSDTDYLVQQWILGIISDTGAITNAFTAAAFLANQQWVDSLWGTGIPIYQDLGTEMEIPNISMVGIIVVSVLMGLYLIPLLGLALYAGLFPRWTKTLDSFVMLRLGAAIGERMLPLLVAQKVDAIQELDKLPGVVHDVSSSTDEANEIIPVGRLRLSKGRPLQRQRRYECYPEDNEHLTLEETMALKRVLHARV